MEFGIIGTSIWQQNMPLLEKLTLDRETKFEQLEQLKEVLGISELIYLSTCNRVEFFYANEENGGRGNLLHRLIDFFFSDGSDMNFFPNDFYHYTGKEAITHLFRTVSSLESLVVGETQITGQFKDAYQEAFDHHLAGETLKNLANEALVVAKQVKRDTGIGEGSQSMASLALDEIKEQLGDRRDLTFALVGAGTMTEKFAKYISKADLGKFIFVNRSVEKAEKLAATYGGEAMSLEEFKNNPRKIDSIISATAAKDPVFDANFIDRLPDSEYPVLCVDLAIPKDFSDSFKIHKQVKLVNIEYLKSKSQKNLRKKFIEASKANGIIKDSVKKFLTERLEVSIKPIFHRSYEESLELAQNAFNDLFNNRLTDLKETDKKAVMNLVNKLIGHSAFQPARKLSKQLALNKSGLEFEDIPVYKKETI